MKTYDSHIFKKSQLEQIELGYNEGLTDDHVGVYAKPGFNPYKMRELRMLFRCGLSDGDITYYAANFDEWQLNVIRVGYELGMSHDEIELLNKPEYSWQQMFRIRTQIRKGEEVHLPLDSVITSAAASRTQNEIEVSQREVLYK